MKDKLIKTKKTINQIFKIRRFKTYFQVEELINLLQELVVEDEVLSLNIDIDDSKTVKYIGETLFNFSYGFIVENSVKDGNKWLINFSIIVKKLIEFLGIDCLEDLEVNCLVVRKAMTIFKKEFLEISKA